MLDQHGDQENSGLVEYLKFPGKVATEETHTRAKDHNL
jgi:hypothetical protein